MGLSSSFLKVNTTQLILSGIVIGAGLYFINKAANKIEDVAGDVANAINITDENNIINQGVSTVVNDLTDGKYKNSGELLFCFLNPDTITCDPNYKYDVQEQL